jgi:hypothetical protein
MTQTPDITPEAVERFYHWPDDQDQCISVTPLVRSSDYDALAARLAEVEVELLIMKTAGIIEVAVRNPSVSEYMAHWENRAEAAEARIEQLAAINEELEAALTLWREYVASESEVGALAFFDAASNATAELKGEKDE